MHFEILTVTRKKKKKKKVLWLYRRTACPNMFEQKIITEFNNIYVEVILTYFTP